MDFYDLLSVIAVARNTECSSSKTVDRLCLIQLPTSLLQKKIPNISLMSNLTTLKSNLSIRNTKDTLFTYLHYNNQTHDKMQFKLKAYLSHNSLWYIYPLLHKVDRVHRIFNITSSKDVSTSTSFHSIFFSSAISLRSAKDWLLWNNKKYISNKLWIINNVKPHIWKTNYVQTSFLLEQKNSLGTITYLVIYPKGILSKYSWVIQDCVKNMFQSGR